MSYFIQNQNLFHEMLLNFEHCFLIIVPIKAIHVHGSLTTIRAQTLLCPTLLEDYKQSPSKQSPNKCRTHESELKVYHPRQHDPWRSGFRGQIYHEEGQKLSVHFPQNSSRVYSDQVQIKRNWGCCLEPKIGGFWIVFVAEIVNGG